MIQPRKVQRAFTGMVGLPPEPDEAAVSPLSPPAPPPPPEAAPPRRGLDGLASQAYRPPRDQITGKVIEIDKGALMESRARAALGLPVIPAANPATYPKPSPRTISSYLELLVMSRFEVAELFEAVVGVTHKDERVLMARAPVEVEAAALKAEIEELKGLLVTRTAQWQKLFRPDDKLDKNSRERLKREEKMLLHEKEAAWRVLRSRLLHWDADPRNYEMKRVLVPVAFGEAFPITHQTLETDVEWVPDELRQPADGVAYFTELMMRVETQIGDDYTIEGYRKVLQLDDDALTYLTEGMTWDGWREWENKVILQAIVVGLIRPDQDLIELYPGLGKYVPPDDPHDTDHSAEDRLAIKTGGGQYGTIYSAGVHVGRHRNYARKLQDFWKPTQYHWGKIGVNDEEQDNSTRPSFDDYSENSNAE